LGFISYGAITLLGTVFQQIPLIKLSLYILSYPTSAEAFEVGLEPLHSPLLRLSQLVSFPPLIDMLKFGG
jgi:hypothetical protein